MARRSRHVEEALDRWVLAGLVDEGLAEALRREEEGHHARRAGRWAQLLVAVLGAVALFLAAVVFARWNWESFSHETRTLILVAGGAAFYGVGLLVHRRDWWRYSGVLLQTGGLGVILFGLAYSNNAWGAGSGGARLMGIVALLVPVVLAPVNFREGRVMAAVHTALSFVYLGLFLERTLGLDFEAAVWVLDGVVLAAVAVQLALLRRWDREEGDTALVAFAASLWAGLVLAMITGFGPLEGSLQGALGMDLWLVVIAALTLWGISRTPSEARRDAFETNLALCVLVGGLLAMFTAGETLDLDAEGAAAAGGMVAALGLAYGLKRRSTHVLVAGALVGLLSTWVFALDQAGALGGVLALLLSAAALFWISTRIRAEPKGGGVASKGGSGAGSPSPPGAGVDGDPGGP